MIILFSKLFSLIRHR